MTMSLVSSAHITTDKPNDCAMFICEILLSTMHYCDLSLFPEG